MLKVDARVGTPQIRHVMALYGEAFWKIAGRRKTGEAFENKKSKYTRIDS